MFRNRSIFDPQGAARQPASRRFLRTVCRPNIDELDPVVLQGNSVVRRCSTATLSGQPARTCYRLVEQAVDRGAIPRFSIGTLQLSIRCSSIHFLPSRSFPVSVADVPARTVGFGATGSIFLSWGHADDAKPVERSEISNPLRNGTMDASRTVGRARASRYAAGKAPVKQD
jgi:hypothetical protein